MLNRLLRAFTMTRSRAVLVPTSSADIEIKGVIFDMDGTLCLPQTYMFQEMRDALGISKGTDILDYVHSLAPAEEEEAQEKLRRIERRAMVRMVPQPGVQQLLSYVSAKKLPKAICTRNFPIPVSHLTTTFLPDHQFEPVITREFKPPKPHPAGILHICAGWNIDPRNTIMVGDSIEDMRAGYQANAITILLANDVNQEAQDAPETDIAVNRLDDIIELFENGFPLKERSL